MLQKKQRICFWVFIVVIFFGTPSVLRADVVINEVAWMGTEVSTADEWMELYNTGSEDIDIRGWTLLTDESEPKPNISLEGVIGAGEYFLLERTDDDSVPEHTADLIYSGDLGNGGETLILQDAFGTEVDRVVGGDDWEDVGGCNDTKDTAQRGQNGSWITGIPTPNAENTTTDVGCVSGSDSGSDTGSGGSSGSDGGSGSGDISHDGYEPGLYAYAGESRRVIVGAETLYEGVAFNERGKRLTQIKYEWNFGNGVERGGREVSYAYPFPGEYVVVLEVTKKNDRQVIAQHEITITAEEADLAISSVAYSDSDQVGYVEITNNDSVPNDLSRWTINVSKHRFIIPDNTLILPGSAVRFDTTVMGMSVREGADVSLAFPDGMIAFEYTPEEMIVLNDEQTVVAEGVPTQEHVSDQTIRHVSAKTVTPPPTIEDIPLALVPSEQTLTAAVVDAVVLGTSTVSQVLTIAPREKGQYDLFIWILVLTGVLLVAISGVVLLRHQPETTKRETDDIKALANTFEIITD